MTNGFGLNREIPEFRGPSNLAGSSEGLVVDGSLPNGVEVRLDSETLIEDLKVGTFVTIQGSLGRFFGTLTEIALGSSDPRLKQNPLTPTCSCLSHDFHGPPAGRPARRRAHLI